MKFLTLDKINFKGKRVLARIDINSDVIKGKIRDNERIKEHSKTIKELSKKNAKIVIIAHQGRKNSKDFISLKQHSKLLSKHIGKKVKFVNSVIGKKAIDEIKNIKNSEILLLENVRFLKKNEEKKFVKILTPYFDYFVMDGFSVAHRDEVSVTGFRKLKTVAGRVMEKELKQLNNLEKVRKPYIFLIGGAKVEDCLLLLNNKKVDKILVSGVLSYLFLMVHGHRIGKREEFLREKGYLKFLKEVKKYKNDKRIILPVDMAIKINGKRKEISINELPSKYLVLDIGSKTINIFKKEIKKAKTIYFKGPPGVYEDKVFEKGTKELLNSFNNSKAFTIIGGGESLDSLNKFVRKRKIKYISLAGGALLYYLTGKKLPGVEILRK